MKPNRNSHIMILQNLAHRVMLARDSLPDFPAAAPVQLKRIEAPDVTLRSELVRDLTHQLWASVDNDNSRALDQLAVAKPLPDNKVKLLVANADVGALIPNSLVLAAHARHNTISVVTAAGIFPMLPEKLSTNLMPVVQNGAVATILVIARDITEQRCVEAAIHQRSRDLIVLDSVISATAISSDPVEILRILCNTLAEAFYLSPATASSLRPEWKVAMVAAEYLTPGRPNAFDAEIPLNQQVAQYMLTTKQPLYIADARADSRFPLSHEETKRRGIVSLLLVPIIVPEQLLGTLGLDALEHPDNTADDLELMLNTAAAARQAIEAANLKQELRKRAQELESVLAQSNEALRQALQQAQADDRSKSQFISNVSHELRTPLASMRVFLELLQVGPPEQHARYLECLSRETSRLQTLIEKTLTISRLDLDKVQIKARAMDLNTLLRTLITDRQQLFAERDLRLVVETAALPEVRADPNLIEQVATNLLTNAMNYTPSGGTVSLITALREADGRVWVTFSVGDTGPGMSLEEQGHLFERFYRGNAAQKSSAPGTGLGLSICKEIMDLLGGRITWVSAPGAGATFTAWLPVI